MQFGIWALLIAVIVSVVMGFFLQMVLGKRAKVLEEKVRKWANEESEAVQQQVAGTLIDNIVKEPTLMEFVSKAVLDPRTVDNIIFIMSTDTRAAKAVRAIVQEHIENEQAHPTIPMVPAPKA